MKTNSPKVSGLKLVLQRLASVRLTLVCIGLLMVLIFFGTLAQVHIGTFAAQKEYFGQFWIYARAGDWKIPISPGGLAVGLAWIVNLLAAFVTQFHYEKKYFGLLLSHFGIIVLFTGQFLSQTLSQESQMPIEVGHSSNFSENGREVELALITSGEHDLEEITAIPQRLLARERLLKIPGKPFSIKVKKFYVNSNVTLAARGSESFATQGVGTRVAVDEVRPVSSDDEMNISSAYIEVFEGDKSLGTWLASTGLGAPQSFFAGGKEYRLSMRPRRHYYPFTLRLKEFHHDIYPGTDIPKNFSSLVRLTDPEKMESRDVLIYMNHPLRYSGYTFYQASFGKNDTLSVFQVVKNPAWLSPYVACVLVVLGLGFHFVQRLREFLRARS